MNNGDFGQPEVWGGTKFDASSLEGVLAPQLGALQDAEGDVKAAEVRLAEAVREEQKRIDKAKGARTEEQEAIARRLEQFALVGRMIDIESGASLEGAYLDIEPDDLTAFAGRITAFEVGTLNGKPLPQSGAVVLHVEAEGGSAQTPDKHAFIAGEVEFTIHPVEQPED